MTLSNALYSRTAALAALGAAMATFVAVLGLALFLFIAFEQDETADSVQQLAAARAEAAARPQVEGAMARLKAQTASMPGLIHGARGAQAAAPVRVRAGEPQPPTQ